MAPTLFKLYACAVVERWLSRVNDTDGVGTHILFKHDQQLPEGILETQVEKN